MKLGSNVDTITGLKDFYEKVESPIDSDATLSEIIEVHKRSSGKVGSFSRVLEKNGAKNKEFGFINTEDRRKFEKKIHGYLECKKVKVSKKAGWMQVKSCLKRTGQADIKSTKHAFYLNIDSTATYAVLDALVEALEKMRMPYYLKFDSVGTKVDNIVIFTPTKDLLKYLDILRQLKLDHLDWVKYFHKPSLLLGKIDDDIGYGAEPEKGSYIRVRAEIIVRVLQEKALDERLSLEEIRKRLREECAKNGIDTERFVFDLTTVAGMKKQSQVDAARKRKRI